MIARREEYLERDLWFRTLYTDPKARMGTFEQVVAEMDATGVDLSVIFGFAFEDQGLCREINDYVIEAVRAYPTRLVGLTSVSPEQPGALAELDRTLDAGLVGCGELFPDGQRFELGKPSGLDRIADALHERHALLMVHSNEPVGHKYPGKGDNTPGPCYQFAERHPGLDIIYAHMGGGLFFYEMMPKAKETLAHVHYDTSAAPYLYRRDIYSLAATAAGAEKILFGSDFPLISPGRYLSDTEDLDPGLRGPIFGGNALRLLEGTGRRAP